ncbi:MAG: tetratricopeptide repeat protein [Bryobacteraceae bacterium]
MLDSRFSLRERVAPVLLVSFLMALPAAAQRGAPSGGSAGGATSTGPTNGAGTGTIGRGTPGNIPGNTYPNSSNYPSTIQRPIFLSGKVMFDDGTSPNMDIRIERVCSGSPHLEGHTDSKGRFSFQVGQNQGMDMDASDSSPGGTFGRGGGMPSMGGMNGMGGNLGTRGGLGAASGLWGCELRAAYPGYRSDVVELGTRHSMDDPEVGTIILHRLSNVQGTTISLTSALAPKGAQKSYEKGMQLAAKSKFEEAEKRLSEATQLYPKYAAAWYALGQLQQQQGRGEDARKAYEAAIAADKKFVSPYDQLARLSAQEGKWEDAANFSKEAISLNPVEFPSSFWYNAIASYNLKRTEDAEKSVKDLLKLDSRHNYPDAENMMAQILLDRGNYPEAATHLRTYLTLVPNAKNADTLKQILLKIDQASAKTPTVPPKD